MAKVWVNQSVRFRAALRSRPFAKPRTGHSRGLAHILQTYRGRALRPGKTKTAVDSRQCPPTLGRLQPNLGWLRLRAHSTQFGKSRPCGWAECDAFGRARLSSWRQSATHARGLGQVSLGLTKFEMVPSLTRLGLVRRFRGGVLFHGAGLVTMRAGFGQQRAGSTQVGARPADFGGGGRGRIWVGFNVRPMTV